MHIATIQLFFFYKVQANGMTVSHNGTRASGMGHEAWDERPSQPKYIQVWLAGSHAVSSFPAGNLSTIRGT